LPHNYVPEAQLRIEIYRKLAQATEEAALERLKAELRDRFGPVPDPVALLLEVTGLKILASEREITGIEVKGGKLMIMRHNDYLMLDGKFPRLTRKTVKGRLKEIKRAMSALDGDRKQSEVGGQILNAKSQRG
jgi:transcription-repair coupling factor (superfamily II helicase)